LIWGIHTPAYNAIETLEQMQGKRYAISRFGSGSHLMAIVDADLRNWSTTDLTFVEVKNLEGARKALAADEADIFFWEKFTTHPFVDNGEFSRIGQRLTPWPAFVVCASDKALAEHPDAIGRLLNQVNKLCRQLTQAPESTITQISQRYELPIDQTTQWFETLQWSFDWQVDQQKFVSAIEYLQSLKLISGPQADQVPADVWDSIYQKLN
jgi:ABC-type nitrate/sulfonate/bicarbonate transport system substrate-binding protein